MKAPSWRLTLLGSILALWLHSAGLRAQDAPVRTISDIPYNTARAETSYAKERRMPASSYSGESEGLSSE